MSVNEYDALLGGQAYDPLLLDEKARTEAGVTLGTSQPVSPDRHAAVLDLATRSKLPTALVERNFDRIQQEQKRAEIPADAILKQTPHTAAWLAESPDNGAVASDDLSRLGWLEWMLTAPQKAFKQGQAQTELGELRYRSIFAPLSAEDQKRLDAARTNMQGDLGEETWFGGVVTGTASYLPQLLEQTKRGVPEGLKLGMTLGAGAALLGQAGPQALVPEELVTVPAATAAGFGAGMLAASAQFGLEQEAGQAYEEFLNFKDENGVTIDPGAAKVAALTAGVLNAGLESFGLGVLLKSAPGLDKATGLAGRAAVKKLLQIPTVRATLTDLAKNYAGTLVQETAVEVAQRAVTILAGELAKVESGAETRTAGDIAGDLVNEASGAVQSFALITAPGPLTRAGLGLRDVQKAKQQQAFFEALGDGMKDSKLAQRMPGKLQELAAQITKDGPVETVYIPANDFRTLFQAREIDPGEAAESLLGSREAYDEALATDGDIAVPMSVYAAQIAPTEMNGDFARVARLRPGEMNAVEAEQFEEQQKREAAENAVPRETDPVDAIREDITGQLLSSGYDRATAETMAELQASFYKAQGAALGVNPMDLFQRFTPSVKTEIPEVLRSVGQTDQIDNLLDRYRLGQIPTEKDAYGKTLLDFIREQGGIRPDELVADSELAARDLTKLGKGSKPIVNNGAKKNLEQMAEVAWEAGFIPEYDYHQLLDAIDEELSGQPVYGSAFVGNDQAKHQLQAFDELGRWLTENGIDIDQMSNAEIKAKLQQVEGQTLDQPAYHGSPHKFELFDLSKIGTGEGAQAFGWGLYFAENKGTAKDYQFINSSISPDEVKYKGKKISTLYAAAVRAQDAANRTDDRAAQSKANAEAYFWESLMTRTHPDKAIQDALDPDSGWPELEAFARGIKREKFVGIEDVGSLYEVDIPDEAVARMLDWDKPLSEQPESVRSALDKLLDSGRLDKESVRAIRGNDSPGAVIYRLIASDLKGPVQAMDSYPGAKTASEELGKIGIPGLRYLDAGSRDAGDGTRNVVIWDQDVLDKVNEKVQTLYQSADGSTPRGSITFSPDRRQFDIRLLKNANLSTFLHESGHQFLEIMGELAADLPADAPLAQQYSAILKWLGVESRDQITTEHHEKFARGFEAYLMEGKAPSIELRAAFARFRAWLVGIYRTVRGLNVELTDEVRQVMDRMLATEDEIAAAQAESSITPLMTSAETLGQTPAEFEAYRKTVEAASIEAKDKVQARTMAQLNREQQKWWKEELAKVADQVEAEVNQQPEYVALSVLKDGVMPDGADVPGPLQGLKLNKAGLEAQYGKATVARKGKPVVPNEVMNKLRALKVWDKNGTSPDVAASLLGFRSSDELVMALVNARPKKALIAAEAERRMLEAHPDVRFDGSLAQEAEIAVNGSDGREKVLRAELAALRKKVREVRPFVRVAEQQGRQALREERAANRAARTEAGSRKAAGLRAIRTAAPSVETLRTVAGQIIAGKRVRDINPAAYLATARWQARKAIEAAAMGEKPIKADPARGLQGYGSGWEWAAELKQRELLNHYLYRKALAAKEQVQKTLYFVKKANSTKSRDRMAKAGYLEQWDGILSRFSFARTSLRKADKKQSLAAWANAQEEAGLPVDLPEHVLDEARREPYVNLTMEELTGVTDALKQIQRFSRLVTKMTAAKDKREWERAKAQLLERVRQSAGGKGPPISTFEDSKWRAHGRAVGQLADALLRPETLVEWLDGGTDGPWHDLLWEPANQAEYARESLRKAIVTPLQKIADGIKGRRRRELEGTVFIRSLGRDLNRRTAISMAMNMGNAGNLERLMRGGIIEGDGVRKLTEGNIAEIRDALSAEDWQMIQAVWDAIEPLWPHIRDLQERLTGQAPPRVEAVPVVTKHGTFRGGYFPVVYDPRGSKAGERQADPGTGTEKLFANFTTAATQKGASKARTGVAGPLLLNFTDVLTRHIDQVITDVSHREFVIDALKILNDKDIKATLLNRAGPMARDSLNGMVRHAVHSDYGFNDAAGKLLSSALRGGVSNLVVAALGLKVVTAFGNAVLAPIQAMARLSPMGVLRGFGLFYSGPKEMLAFVNDRSAMMRNRRDNLDDSLVQTLQRLRGQRGIRAQVARAAMSVHWASDWVTSYALWIGRYDHALRGGQTEEEAARLADKLIRTTQTAGAAKDLSAIERNPALRETGMNLFMGPLLIMGNRMREAVERKGVVKSWPEAAGVLMATWILPAIVWELVTGRGPDGDDDESKVAWALRKVMSYPFQGVPIIRDVASLIEAKVAGTYAYSRPVPLLDAATTMVKAGETAIKEGHEMWEGGDPDTEKLTIDTLRALGLAYGLPSNQLATTVDFLHDVSAGDFQPESPLDWRYLVMTRPKELR